MLHFQKNSSRDKKENDWEIDGVRDKISDAFSKAALSDLNLLSK